MLRPNAYDIFICGAAFNAAQLLTTYLIRRRLSIESSERDVPYAPSVTIVVACKGDPPDFLGNITSLFDQDYPGLREYLLATPSRSDPAHQALEGLLASRRDIRARLCASEALPSRSSGKALDLNHALRREPPQTDVLLFADADMRVHRRWVTDMTSALRDDRVGATTSALIAVPHQIGFWSFLRFIWLGVSVSFWSFMGAVCGQSLAMRRKDFYDLEVPTLWEGALLEDLALTKRLRKWGKEVRFIARAMPVTVGDCDAHQFFDVFNRWIKCCRMFDASVWLLGLGYLAVKAGITVWSAYHREWRLLGAFWALDMLNVGLLFAVYRRFLPDRFAGLPCAYRPISLLAALASPVLTAVYLLNYLASVLDDSVPWGSYVYHVGRDKRLKVVRR